jgi:hypothetical protein
LSDSLSTIAELSDIDSDPVGTMAVARSIFSHLPATGAHVWQGRKQVISSDPRLSVDAMASRA